MFKLGVIGVLILSAGFSAYGDIAPDISHAKQLADGGYIVERSDLNGYGFSRDILRQEVIGIAVKIAGIQLPDSYECKGYYADLSSSNPNGWACRAVEIAADNGLVTKANARFRPEDKVSKAEAVAIIASALTIDPGGAEGSFDADATDWQKPYINHLKLKGVISNTLGFNPNISASRGFVIMMTAELFPKNSGYTSYKSKFLQETILNEAADSAGVNTTMNRDSADEETTSGYDRYSRKNIKFELFSRE